MSRPNHGPRLRPNKAGVYFIHWSENNRSKRRSTGTGNLSEAQKILAGFLLEDEKQKMEGARPSVGWVLDYYNVNHVTPNVVDKKRQRKALSYMRDLLGEDTYVDELASEDFVRYANKRRKMRSSNGHRGEETSQSAIARELNVFVAACNFAVRNRKMENRHVPVVDLPDPNPSKDRWLTREEAAKLMAKAQPAGARKLTREYLFIAIALSCGKRRRAIETLSWFKVDFKNRSMDFRKSGEPETKKRRGRAPISDWLLPILERAFRERDSEWVLGDTAQITRGFDRARDAAGLPDVTPHTLRHTWGTWAAQAGMSMWEVAGVMGCTVQTATNNYLHHSPEHLRSIVDRVSPVAVSVVAPEVPNAGLNTGRN